MGGTEIYQPLLQIFRGSFDGSVANTNTNTNTDTTTTTTNTNTTNKGENGRKESEREKEKEKGKEEEEEEKKIGNRQIFVLTDGEVFDESRVFELVKNHASK